MREKKEKHPLMTKGFTSNDGHVSYLVICKKMFSAANRTSDTTVIYKIQRCRKYQYDDIYKQIPLGL